MKSVKYASTLLLLLSMPLAAMAQGQMNSVYNNSKKEVLISGTVEQVYGNVSITVTPKDVDPDTLNENTINTNQYILRQTQSDENGEFSLNIKLSQNAESDIYTVYAFCGEESLTSSFSHVSDGEVTEVVNAINASTAETVVGIFTASQKKLGLSDEIMTKAEKIAPIIYRMKPGSGYTSKTFLDELNRAVSIICIAQGDDVKTVLTKYGQSFELSADSVNKFSENICDDVKGYFISHPDFFDSKKYLYQAITYAGFCNAVSYVEVEEVLNDYGKKGGVDFKDYDTLSATSKSSVMQQLFNESPTDFNALLSAFVSITDKVKASGKKTSTGGSVGGGGGGISTVGSAPKKPSYNGFIDMENHWSRTYVESLTGSGIISGFEDNSFRPENYVTRAEFIKLVLLVTGGKLSDMNYFNDVNANDWFMPYVNGAKEIGLCTGFDGKINPNDNITREDAAVMLYRTLKIKNDITDNSIYSDGSDIADYAKEAVAFLTQNGIVTGSGSSFSPKSPTKRGEAAALISRLTNYNGGR